MRLRSDTESVELGIYGSAVMHRRIHLLFSTVWICFRPRVWGVVRKRRATRHHRRSCRRTSRDPCGIRHIIHSSKEGRQMQASLVRMPRMLSCGPWHDRPGSQTRRSLCFVDSVSCTETQSQGTRPLCMRMCLHRLDRALCSPRSSGQVCRRTRPAAMRYRTMRRRL